MCPDLIGITIFMNEGVEVLPPETLAQLSYFGFEMQCGATENGRKIRFQTKTKKSVLGEAILQMLVASKFNNIFIAVDIEKNPPSNYWFSQTHDGWEVCGRIQDDALQISVCQNTPACRCKAQPQNDESHIPNLNQMFLEAIDHFNAQQE